MRHARRRFDNPAPARQLVTKMGNAADFDPVNQLSTAPLARPEGLGPLNLRALTPFQRALLVIDGTVTTFIEAYTLEPVDIERVSHVVRPLTEPDPWLEAEAGTMIALRQVLIQGRYSRTLHVFAVSLVAVERLPAVARERLEVEGEGIGRVLAASRLETRREVLWYGRERAADLPEAVRSRCDGEFITRTYRILSAGRPIALISERFPIGAERLPSQY